MLPFVFSAMAMNAVGRAAMAMIEEVRRQFRDIPKLKAALAVMRKYDSDMTKASAADRKIFDAADGVAEYDKCVDISTKASIKEMVAPGLLAIIVPVLVGFGGKWVGVGGPEMLGGLLAGVTSSGVLMAIFQSNAGGAWDNAKKTIEEQGRKGTEAHKASVVGDTVGDPFKDTSGPSLNILLKLMSVVALVIAPSIAMDVSSSSSNATNSYVVSNVAVTNLIINSVAENFETKMNEELELMLVENIITSNINCGSTIKEECEKVLAQLGNQLEFYANSNTLSSSKKPFLISVDGVVKTKGVSKNATLLYNQMGESGFAGELKFDGLTISIKGKK
jgi:K(+)-stimulated pyrophosphate-energized sodium pump